METINLTEEMFKSGRPFAQGDVRIWMKKYAPADLIPSETEEVKAENGMLIVAHSETGHHHAIDVLERPDAPYSVSAQMFIDKMNDLVHELKLHEESLLVHHRHDDTHKAYRLAPGEYITRNDTEFTPEGLRRVQD